MSRVESKKLFNFPLTGLYDDDVAEMDAKMIKQLYTSSEAMEMNELINKNDPESNVKYVSMFRNVCDGIMKPILDHPTLNKSTEMVIEEVIKVPTNHCGKFDVPVFKYTPKTLLGDGTKPAAYIYAHGGGVVAIEASTYKPLLCHYAVECDVVMFNVDYRLAPETKCPNNVKDFYEVIKYVHENADVLGVDSTKIVVGGESGGGYICLGSMVLLAQRNQANIVKLAIPCIPMVDDYAFSDPLSMTKEENENNAMMRKMWNFIAEDLDDQKSDPLLFPGKASDELLEKFPPIIIEECEFDMLITEATRIANRLRRAGRLLELIIIPGAIHASTMNPALKCFKKATDAKKLAFQHYVQN